MVSIPNLGESGDETVFQTFGDENVQSLDNQYLTW